MNCINCNKPLDPQWSEKYLYCNDCMAKEYQAPDEPKYNKSLRMLCECGSGVWELYYNRVTCKECGNSYGMSLSSDFKIWQKEGRVDT